MPEMKRLIFGEGFLAPTLEGDKLFTVRKYREGSHDFTKGEIIKGEFKDGLTVLLQITYDTKICAFKDLKKPKRDLDENGYYFDDEYFNDLAAFYTNLTWGDTGAIVFFEVLKVNGVPVVSINQQTE